MTPAAKSKKDALLEEVLHAGSGKGHESALEKPKLANKKGKPEPVAQPGPGRPRQEPTIPFTLRLPQDAAALLQSLVADLQARALRGEFPRSEATIGRVVQDALALYAAKHHRKPS